VFPYYRNLYNGGKQEDINIACTVATRQHHIVYSGNKTASYRVQQQQDSIISCTAATRQHYIVYSGNKTASYRVQHHIVYSSNKTASYRVQQQQDSIISCTENKHSDPRPYVIIKYGRSADSTDQSDWLADSTGTV
jgi:hypothetical protein